MLSWSRDAILRTYMRLPEHPTKYRVVRWLGRNVFPEPGVWATVYPNVRLRLHPRDWIEYVLLRGDRYEPRTLAFLAANLRPGDAAVLAGVNFGLHVVVAARAVGAGGAVIGVDPQPAALLRTRFHLEANGLSGPVTLVSGGLGTGWGLVGMAWSTAENAGTASFLAQGDGFRSRSSRSAR
jgi:hypothetical protein